MVMTVPGGRALTVLQPRSLARCSAVSAVRPTYAPGVSSGWAEGVGMGAIPLTVGGPGRRRNPGRRPVARHPHVLHRSRLCHRITTRVPAGLPHPNARFTTRRTVIAQAGKRPAEKTGKRVEYLMPDAVDFPPQNPPASERSVENSSFLIAPLSHAHNIHTIGPARPRGSARIADDSNHPLSGIGAAAAGTDAGGRHERGSRRHGRRLLRGSRPRTAHRHFRTCRGIAEPVGSSVRFRSLSRVTPAAAHPLSSS